MAKGNSLGLTLPPQTKPGDGSFTISARPLAAWISELPIANIGDTTRQLYQTLHEVNRQSHDWKRRYRFLETIRNPLDAMQRALGQRFAGLSFPLPARTLQVAKLSQKLHLEMATGYMAAIEGMLDSHFLFHDRRALKIMVHRASRHLNQSLLTGYQVYCQQHSGIWQQLHRLYAFAEARNFHQDPIKDAFFTELPVSSIARVYKQIVLLATASPYRMRQGEAIVVHKALARWSAHAKLLGAHEAAGNRHALFTLHLNSDEEPTYRTLDHLPCDGTTCRLIDTRQFVSVVQEEANSAEGGSFFSSFTPELYKRLIQGWETAPARAERRNEGGDSIEVVIGMIHIHQLLSPTQQPPTQPHAPFANTPPPAAPKPSTAARRSSDDPWNPYSKSERNASHASSLPLQAVPSPLILHWQIINESVGGFRLAVPEGQEAAVRVGEVLAVREVHAPDRWHLTVVRWIRHFDLALFEAGVQIIASDTVPIMVKNTTPGKDKGEYQRGLLLPEAPERNLPVSLFIPNRLFNPAEKVLLDVSGQQIEIVLGIAIQDSGSFVQFGFHPREKRDNVPIHPGGSPFEMRGGRL